MTHSPNVSADPIDISPRVAANRRNTVNTDKCPGSHWLYRNLYVIQCLHTHPTWHSPDDAVNKPVRRFDDKCRYCRNSSLDLDWAADVVAMANIACYSTQTSPNRYSTTNDVDGGADNDAESIRNCCSIHCLHTTMTACCCFRFLLWDKRNGKPDSCKYFLLNKMGTGEKKRFWFI